MLTPLHENPPTSPSQGKGKDGFTLVELLVVIGLMGMLMVLAKPALSSLQNAGGLTKAASDIGGIFEQSRAYAMANNTYVYAGIQEVDGMNPSSSNGIGRVVIAVIASRDGTRPYTNTPGPLTTNDIFPIGKAQYFDSIHLTNVAALTNSPNMIRPTNALVDLWASNSMVSFQIPFAPAKPKYIFNNVVEFDPQGVPRYQMTATYNASIQNYYDLAIIPAHANVPMLHSANQAAVRIDGITGAVRVYRP